MTWPPRGTCRPHVPHLTPAPADTWRDKALCAEIDPDLLFPEAAHIVRHDPARVLREVAAKRQIVNEIALIGDPTVADALLRTLASVYQED